MDELRLPALCGFDRPALCECAWIRLGFLRVGADFLSFDAIAKGSCRSGVLCLGVSETWVDGTQDSDGSGNS